MHFAKQLVRFLRNALIAKVAGSDSPLLQISSDERQKVAHTASLFSEEDLTRFLNIVLRTHDELGYREEQRFHLELGMLKLVHAHRLLPLEELLSQSAASNTATSRPPVASSSARTGETKPSSLGSGTKSVASSPFKPSNAVVTSPTSGRPQASPFELDRLRKARSEPEMSQSSSSPSAEAKPQFRPGPLEASLKPAGLSSTATAVAEAPEENALPTSGAPEISVESLRAALVGILEAQQQDTAADLLARGEWKLEGNQISLRLPLSDKLIDITLSAEAKRLLTQEANRLCGRTMKLSIAGGGTAQNATVERSAVPNGNSNGIGARQRAADDPIVQRMQEKFGAEVRTVVDLRQKR
jgi:DNA polymerase III subunit gamma/tau